MGRLWATLVLHLKFWLESHVLFGRSPDQLEKVISVYLGHHREVNFNRQDGIYVIKKKKKSLQTITGINGKKPLKESINKRM